MSEFWETSSVERHVRMRSRWADGGAWRMLLARCVQPAKGAVAAGLAWSLAPYLPGGMGEYSYYAPLGVVIAMQATVAQGLRDAGRTLGAAALGTLCALVALLLPGVGTTAVTLLVGVTMLLGRLRILGGSGSWVATAAIFVLLVGGDRPEDFSSGYLVQMGFGIIVGLVINAVVMPPLFLNDSAGEMVSLGRRLDRHLDDLAAALSDGTPSSEAWGREMTDLERQVDRTRTLMREAADSRKLNMRRWRSSRTRANAQADEFRVIERSLFYITDLTELFTDHGPAVNALGGMTPHVRELAVPAVRAVARYLAAPEQGTDEVNACLDELASQLGAHADGRLRDVSISMRALTALYGIVEARRAGAA